MDPPAAALNPGLSDANAAVGELPDISNTEFSFMKKTHFLAFFNGGKFQGAAEYAAQYFRDLQQALASFGYATIGNGSSSVLWITLRC